MSHTPEFAEALQSAAVRISEIAPGLPPEAAITILRHLATGHCVQVETRGPESVLLVVDGVRLDLLIQHLKAT